MSAALTSTATVLADHWHHGGGWWFPWFPLVPLFFAGLWVFLLVFVLPRRWRGNGGPSAEAVLAERYARGEIDEREFRERRAVLRGKG